MVRKKKKIDLVPRHRFQKDDINVKRESIKKRCQSANKFKNANSSRVKSATEGKEEEIKMIYNTNHNVDVIATKANKNPLVLNGSKTSKVGNIGNPALFEKFEETLQKMQNELNKKNSQPPKQIENDVKKETIKKEDYNEEEEEHEVIEQPKLDFNKNKVDDNNINEIEKIDVKGIDDEKLIRHQEYMINFLCIIFEMIQSSSITDVIQYIIQFSEKYKSRELPTGYYREFNADSAYRITINGCNYITDFVSEEESKYLNISVNYSFIVELYKLVTSIYYQTR